MSAETFVRLEGVAKIYGRKLIFKNLDLAFAAGTLTLVTGANGSGKSTLLKLLAGISQPSSGHVIMADTSRPAYLGHATFLYPSLTAVENLAFWAKTGGIEVSPADLEEILENVGLLAHAHEKVAIFSRGMAQRLNFARILALKPGLVLLDEPFTGLDAESRHMMRQAILNFRQQGACLVMVSHEPASDSPMADRVLAIQKGKILILQGDNLPEPQKC